MDADDEVQDRQRRAAMNEAQFREMNEAIERQQRTAAFGEYICECSQKTCTVTVSLSLEEYEEVRRVATHFIVTPGHTVGAVEKIVRETPRYQVVEKVGVAGRIASRMDPRSP
jgi:hypothetical protein